MDGFLQFEAYFFLAVQPRSFEQRAADLGAASMAKVNPDDTPQAADVAALDDTKSNEAVYTAMDRYYYKLDAVIASKGGQAYILIFTCLIFTVIAGAVFAWVVPASECTAAGTCSDDDFNWRVHEHLVQGMWEAWSYMADPGTHAGVPNTLPVRVVALVITWFGIIFFAVIIGFVVDAIQEKHKALQEASWKVTQSAYQSAGGDQGADPSSNTEGGDKKEQKM